MELQGLGITAASYRFAIIVSRFNEEITEGLLKGACAALSRRRCAPMTSRSSECRAPSRFRSRRDVWPRPDASMPSSASDA